MNRVRYAKSLESCAWKLVCSLARRSGAAKVLARRTALFYCLARDAEGRRYVPSFDLATKLMHFRRLRLTAGSRYLPLHCARRLMS